MMTTTYSHHAGGIHPGMAHGQPMGPAPGQNPGQPIGQPMQMHPGVSGPNGPHVTQAGAMMGMQPGVGGVGGPIQGQPSAHAMAHLGPQQAQAHLYQQHQQQMQQAMAANPALAQRQQFLRQQQQQQHLLQQQQQQNAMMFQGGMNPAMSGAPQMQAMMSANPQMVPGLPPHMRQQLAAQQQMHQQQQAAQAHQQQAQAQAQAQQQQQAQAQQAQQQQAAQAQQQQQAQAQQAQQQQAQAAQAQAAQAQAQQAQAAQAQAAQAQAQQQQQAQAQQAQAQQAQAAQAQQAQQQAQQLQQHLAMQHASSQQSNQGQGSAAAGPQQGPTRPPSQMGGANQAQASPAAQPTPQPTESAQPSAQQTAQQSAQPAQQAQNQAQAQNAAQAGQPTAAQQAQQAQQAQAAGLSVQQMQLLRRQQQAQQAQQAQRMKGAMILQLLQFSDHLSRFSCANTKQNSLAHWQNFVQRFFAEDGSFKQTVKDITDPSSKPKQFEICYTALPRYYWTQYASGVENIQVSLDGANEKDLPNTGHIVECARAKFIYWFRNGTQLVCTGRLVAVFGQGEKMDTLSFETQDHQQYLPRGNIERLFAQDSPNQKLSPRLSKTSAKQRNQQRNQPPADPTITLSDLPEPPVGGWGITNRILSYLETGETISYMQDLIVHYHSNPGKTSSEALSDLISTYPTFNPQQLTQQQLAHAQQLGLTNNAAMMQQQQQIQPGARTPSGTGGAAATPGAQGPFMSPHLANLGLPNAMNGSPHLSMQTHTPSPGQAHSLVHTHSQQGTNSSVASANTSPNVSNKRRRPSAVKVEGDDGGGGDVNGSGVTQKVKQSPRGNQNKRVKANAS